MKTFETEKHNIPEGATHYRDECKEYQFSWVKFASDSMYLWCETYWDETADYIFECSVKPIPQTNIETPEEKEALDTMTGISREHLMKVIEKQTETITKLIERIDDAELESHSSKGLNTSESPNGSNEIIKPLWAKWSIGDSVTKTKGSSWTGKVVGYYQTDLTSKGYAVESETEKGSVQIYPEAALCSLEQLPQKQGERERKESRSKIEELLERDINFHNSMLPKTISRIIHDAGYRKQ